MNKVQRILAGVLAVQLLLAVIVFWPRPEAGAGATLLPDFDPAGVTEILIEDGASGQLIRVARQGDGWVLPEADDYPVTAAIVLTLLEKLPLLTDGRQVADTAASHERLQVSQEIFVRRLTFINADNSQQVVYIGSSTGALSTHVRLEGQEPVYLSADLRATDAPATLAGWIDAAYLTLNVDTLTGVSLVNANGEFVFNKDENGQWIFENQTDMDGFFEASRLNNLLSGIANLRMTAPLGVSQQPAYGLDEPQAVLTFRIQGESASEELVLTIGAADETGTTLVVKSSGSDYYARVSSFSLDSWVSNTEVDFLTFPPTPTPAP